jgi:hypothetical protein
MIRFLLFLLGKTNYEPCKSCEVLKQQLTLANEEKKDLTSTLLNLLKPQIQELPVAEIQAIPQAANTWSKRRAILEETERQKARVLRESNVVAMPDKPKDAIDNLEEELGIAGDV